MNKKGINIFKVHEMYKSGMSVKKIAEEFHCSKSNIYKRLNKLEVYPDRTNVDLPERNFCQYHVNVNFFDDIDSELKAYILGIMCSDGSVYKNRIYLTNLFSFILFNKISDIFFPFFMIFYK